MREDMNDVIQLLGILKSNLQKRDHEITTMKNELRSAHNEIKSLHQRVNSFEYYYNSNTDKVRATHPSIPSKCLLIGDTNLRRMLKSDLKENCQIKTVKGSNIDMQRQWVHKFLKVIPTECIIYSGMYDILNNVSTDVILDNLGYLISDLKDKNNNIKTYVCQIVPMPIPHAAQTKVVEYNEQLVEWCRHNKDCSFIQTWHRRD